MGKTAIMEKLKINSRGQASQPVAPDMPLRITKCGKCKLDMIDQIDSNPLKCEICGMNFHDKCLPFDCYTADSFRKLVDVVGWSCPRCNDRARESIKSISSSINQVDPSIFNKLCTDFDDFDVLY